MFRSVNLFHLDKGDIRPEDFELIDDPFMTWFDVCEEIDASGADINQIFAELCSSDIDYADDPSHDPKRRLEQMLACGKVIFLSNRGSVGQLFYINDTGQLICTNPYAFEDNGYLHIIEAYNDAVRSRHYTNGSPRATQRGYIASGPVQHAQSAKKQLTTLNNANVGRLLAAGGIYNQNPEMFAETARKLGVEASDGFEQVLNEQSAGSLVALGSLFALTKASKSNVSMDELEKLKGYLGTYKKNPVLLQRIDIVKMDYVRRSPVERDLLRREFDSGVRKNFLKDIANNPEVVKRLDTLDRNTLAKGFVPDGYQVHHKLPLDDSGNNSFDNLVLISTRPEHAAFTTAQKRITASLSPTGTNTVLWPKPQGVIYP